MKKKRPFLLIEVLIAILLVSICLIPLIKTPIESYQSEIKWLEEMEGERLAEWTFTEVKEILLKNEIPWEKIPLPGSKTAPFELPPAQIHVPGCKPKEIKRSYILVCGKEKEKIGLRGEIYRMLTVAIQFEPSLKKAPFYRFPLLVQRTQPR